MQDWVIVAVVFASVFSLFWGIRYLLVPKVEEPSEAMKRRFREIANAGGPSLQEISAQAYMRHEELSSIRFLDRVLAGLPRLVHLRDLLNKAGRPMNLGTLVLLCGTLAMAGVVLGLAFELSVFTLPLSIVLGLAPISILKKIKAKRLAVFESQFPEAVELVTRALKAGHSFSAGLKMAADEMSDPIKAEFTKTFEDYSFGKTMDHALDGLVSRVELADVKFFASAVNLQRETGGNLTELLENLGYVIRERFKLQRTVRALSAEGRLSGKILAMMPPALFLLLYLSAPDYVYMALDHPIGRMMYIIGAGFELLGILVIKKLVKLDI
jgi:tight adherence protein B